MTQRPAWETDSYRRTLDTEVAASGSDERGAWIVLADTVLYPEGGGQPRDRGDVARRPVLDLVRTPGGVRHYLDVPPGAAPPRGRVTVTLDWARRFDHMVQHTAQHLLTALTHALLGRPTTSFHLGSDRCDIEVTGSQPAEAEMDVLEEAAATAIREARAVRPHWITRAEYDTRSDIRTRGLPDHHTGDVRLIEIDGIDLTACGGTHVARTSELEAIKILSSEAMRGGTRIHWVAGARVRRRLSDHETRASALRGLLGVGDEELVGAVKRRLDQSRDAERRVRALEGDLAEAIVARLLLGGEAMVTKHFTDRDGGFLRELANRFADAAGARSALFTATSDGATFFALATGPDAPSGASVLGPSVAEAVGGRGGGRERVFQGKAPDTVTAETLQSALRSLLSP